MVRSANSSIVIGRFSPDEGFIILVSGSWTTIVWIYHGVRLRANILGARAQAHELHLSKMAITDHITKLFRPRRENQSDPKVERFEAEFRDFRKLSIAAGRDFKIEWEDRYPCLEDRTAESGFDRHYIYHTAWAARKVVGSRVSEHHDISSSLYFCAILSAWVKVNYYEYRPADLRLGNLELHSADLTDLPFADDSIKSLSCMHVVEHVGLGRYGDPFDPYGDVKAVRELIRVLEPGGKLLFVVPVGEPRICFNAHRIYSYTHIEELFQDLVMVECALIPDKWEDGGLIVNPPRETVDAQKYACGCFEFVK